MVGTPEFHVLSPQQSLASPSFPHAPTGPLENTASKAGGENLCAPGWASWIWFMRSCAHLLAPQWSSCHSVFKTLNDEGEKGHVRAFL